MRRRTFLPILPLLPALTFLSGCATTEQRDTLAQGPTVGYGSSALLFDAHPGYPTASDIRHATSWPAVQRQYVEPELVYYTERVYDYQGPTNLHTDRTYRSFQYRREGAVNR